MTTRYDCTICHLAEYKHGDDYHKFKCALCKIVERAQYACDHPEDKISASESLNFILTTASVALILDLIPTSSNPKK